MPNIRGRRVYLILLFAAAVGLASCARSLAVSSRTFDAESCAVAGRWLDPATGKALAADQLMARLSDKAVVLLGETHTAREHHHWQAQTLAALHAHKPDMAVGFEMFPRRVQPALEAWSRGELTEKQFLEKTEWNQVWRFDPAMYMPLFQVVRQNRLPAIALNVERRLVSRVGREGWEAVPAEEREGVSRPAPASAVYRRSLALVFQQKMGHRGAAKTGEDTPVPSVDEILKDDAFDRFVQAQLTWDRAMAEAIAGAVKAKPDRLVAGIVGRGHAEYGFGIPHQLADLGIDRVAVLLPIETGEACTQTDAEAADAVFLVDPEKAAAGAPRKPKLGVMIEKSAEGIRIVKVLEESIAEAAELQAGDTVVEAAGVPVKDTLDLIAVIQRQAPGTWLPLGILRDGRKRQHVAKFPAAPE